MRLVDRFWQKLENLEERIRGPQKSTCTPPDDFSWVQRQVQLMKGLSLIDSGSLHEAVEVFNSLLREHPNDGDARLYRARAYAQLGRLQEARDSIDEMLFFNPEDPILENWKRFLSQPMPVFLDAPVPLSKHIFMFEKLRPINPSVPYMQRPSIVPSTVVGL